MPATGAGGDIMYMRGRTIPALSSEVAAHLVFFGVINGRGVNTSRGFSSHSYHNVYIGFKTI
jgi:hypothetical protein